MFFELLFFFRSYFFEVVFLFEVSIDIFKAILSSMYAKFAILKLFQVVAVGRLVGNTLRIKPANYTELGKKSQFSNF